MANHLHFKPATETSIGVFLSTYTGSIITCMTGTLQLNACIPSWRQSCAQEQAWNSTVIAIVHDVAEPARCVGAKDAEQDGQSASQVSGEAARYADKPGNIGRPTPMARYV